MSSDIAIRVENLGKRYIIGRERPMPKTFPGKVGRLLASPFDWLVGQVRGPSEEEIFWALRDVSFEVKRGEVLGIIGRNGAGKSTLLKILSRITEPTEGRADIHGRVGSLLEVGTGMHPELTGRENIFLNGCILGMRKREIELKFDEIVDFSGIEKFIDTPVKRYSSGMRVRLGFAIAAHLEPEILIIDEVLAVGDAEFQKKCLGKMHDVAGHGRTVLFVSHNMAAVCQLCATAVRLEHGAIVETGAADEVVGSYLGINAESTFSRTWECPDQAPGTDRIRFHRVSLIYPGVAYQAAIMTDMSLEIDCMFWNFAPEAGLTLRIHLIDAAGNVVFRVASEITRLPPGLVQGRLKLPRGLLNGGNFMLDFVILLDGRGECHLTPGLTFSVTPPIATPNWGSRVPGALRPRFLEFPLKFRGDSLE